MGFIVAVHIPIAGLALLPLLTGMPLLLGPIHMAANSQPGGAGFPKPEEGGHALSEGTTTAHIVETGESAFAVSINVSGHALVGDEPVAKGGGNLGPAPYDFLLAALGECTAMTVRWYARQHNWPLERVEVAVTHAKGGAEGKSAKTDHFAKTIRISGENLTEEQRDKLFAVASRCPVQRTLEGTPVIVTRSAG